MTTRHPVLRTPGLIILCLLLTTAFTDCPISYYPSLTTYGNVQAIFNNYSPNQNSQSYQYPLVAEIQDKTTSHAVVAVNGLSLQKRSTDLSYKILISYPPNKSTSVIFTVATNLGQSANTWQYILFSFIVSESSQLLLGNANARALLPIAADTNSYMVSQTISSPILTSNVKLTTKIFLSGLDIVQRDKLTAQTIQKIDQTIAKIQALKNYSWNQELIKKFNSMLTNQKIPNLRFGEPQFSNGVLSFQVSTAQIDIRFLSFSYLIYIQKLNEAQNYNIVYGSFIANGQSVFYYTSLQNSDMMIMGISSIKYSSTQTGQMSLQINNVQSPTQSSVTSAVAGPSAEYQFQYFSMQTVSNNKCSSCPGSPIIFQEFCVSQCPYGFIVATNAQGNSECQQCNIQNFMIPSPDKRSCICAIGRYLVAPTEICDVCPFDCLTCNGNICLTCDTNPQTTYRTLNPQTNRCECPAFGYYDDKLSQRRGCVQCNARCQTCTGSLITQCTSCPANRILQNNMCVCQTNFVENQNGLCVCQAPYSFSGTGQCVLVQSYCPQNQTLATSSGQLVCNCNSGFTRNIVTNKCVQECQSYEQFNYNTGKCDCRQGFIRNTTNSICYACASRLNQIYNQVTNTCECLSGFELNRAGQCAACPAKSYYNPRTDQCECIFNFYPLYVGGPCAKCTAQINSPYCQVINGIGGLQL